MGVLKECDFDKLRSFMTEDHLFFLNGWQCAGEDDLRKCWEGWWKLVPDSQSQIIEVMESGDKVITHLEVSGDKVVKNNKVVMGQWKFHVAQIYYFRKGKIKILKEFCDVSSLNKVVNSI